MTETVKRAKCVIGTHNGKFHCDEVLACRLLKSLPDYQHAEIVRSRDPSKLDECDIVVDVGGVYDPERHRYDHHQRLVSIYLFIFIIILFYIYVLFFVIYSLVLILNLLILFFVRSRR